MKLFKPGPANLSRSERVLQQVNGTRKNTLVPVVQLLNSFLLDCRRHQDLSRLLFHAAFQTLIECRAL